MMNNKFLQNEDFDACLMLFENCRVTLGPVYASIQDLQRNTLEVFPSGVFQYLSDKWGSSLNSLISSLAEENKETFLEYISYLFEKEYVYTCSESERVFFPKMDTKWDHHSKITNCIIDFDEKSDHDIEVLLNELGNVSCEAIEIRFFKTVTLVEIQEVLQFFDGSNIISISVKANVSDTDDAMTKENLHRLGIKFPRVHEIIFFGYGGGIETDPSYQIIWEDYEMNSIHQCGAISKEIFAVNQNHYLESKNHNNCLNRKVSVGSDGEIRNCPSMSNGFGKLGEVDFIELSKNKLFTDVWNVNKDQVETCRHCEFRYVCTDCRAYTQDSDEKHGKPAQCAYDPFTGIWH